MKTISKKELASLPKGFQESIIERSQINVAIQNANTFRKYAKDCLRYHKEQPDAHWNEQGLNSLMPYYKELLAVKQLADKYHRLWGEKYYKCIHQCETIIDKLQ